MDVLDRSPRLDFFPVSPPPANPSSLDPASTPPANSQFAQALAQAPIALQAAPPTSPPSVDAATAVTTVIEAALPSPVDEPAHAAIDPADLLTASIQIVALPLPSLEEISAPVPVENEPAATAPVEKPVGSVSGVTPTPSIAPHIIPVGLAQGLAIDPPVQTISVKPNDTPLPDVVTPTITSFVISIPDAPISFAPVDPTPSITVTPPPPVSFEGPSGETAQDINEESTTQVQVVSPSFVALTMPQSLSVKPVVTPSASPRTRTAPAKTTTASTSTAELTTVAPIVVPAALALPNVPASEPVAVAPNAVVTDATPSVNDAPAVAESVSETSPAAVTTPSLPPQPLSPPVPATQPIPVPPPPHQAAVTPAKSQVVAGQPPIPEAGHQTVLEPIAPLQQAVVNAVPTTITPPVVPAVVHPSRIAPAKTTKRDDPVDETASTTTLAPALNMPPVASPVTYTPTPITMEAVPPTSSASTIAPIASVSSTPTVEETAAPVVTSQPVAVTTSDSDVEPTPSSQMTTDPMTVTSNQPSSPTPLHARKVAASSAAVNVVSTAPVPVDTRVTDTPRNQDESFKTAVTPAAPRLVEPHVSLPPALDFGDPVPIHETQQVMQRLGDAIGLSQESGQHLSIRVTPPQFGPIVVNVQMHEGTVSARVETHSALAQQMLTEHLPQLHETLASRGAVIDRIDVVPAENRGNDRSERVEAVSTESNANGWMSSEMSGRQGYDPQDSSRRRPPRPAVVPPKRDAAAAVEPVTNSRPVQLQELNVRV